MSDEADEGTKLDQREFASTVIALIRSQRGDAGERVLVHGPIRVRVPLRYLQDANLYRLTRHEDEATNEVVFTVERDGGLP